MPYKRIALIVISVIFSYCSLLFFLQENTNALINNKLDNDVLLRKNFLEKSLTENYRFNVGAPSQQEAEYTFGAFANATYAFTNIAMMDPNFAKEADIYTTKWIKAVQTKDIYQFDEKAWAENPLSQNALNSDTGHIAYYGHLNLMLGAHALLTKNDEFKKLHLNLTNAIAKRLNKHSFHLAETYQYQVWPIDNVVAVASLKIADQTLGTDHSTLIESWINETKKSSDPKTGFPPYRVDSDDGTPKESFRGTNIAWNSFFLPLINKTYANEQFLEFEKTMKIQGLGFAGFKDTIEDKNTYIERDSGPVFYGVGTAATGFAIAGAKRTKDKKLLTDLLRTIEIAGFSVTKGNERHYLGMPIIGDAIILAMKTSIDWKPLWQN